MQGEVTDKCSVVRLRASNSKLYSVPEESACSESRVIATRFNSNWRNDSNVFDMSHEEPRVVKSLKQYLDELSVERINKRHYEDLHRIADMFMIPNLEIKLCWEEWKIEMSTKRYSKEHIKDACDHFFLTVIHQHFLGQWQRNDSIHRWEDLDGPRFAMYGPIIDLDLNKEWPRQSYWESSLETIQKAFGGKRPLEAGIVIIEARSVGQTDDEIPAALIFSRFSSRKIRIQLRGKRNSEALRQNACRLIRWLSHEICWLYDGVRHIDHTRFLAKLYSEDLEDSAKQWADSYLARPWADRCRDPPTFPTLDEILHVKSIGNECAKARVLEDNRAKRKRDPDVSDEAIKRTRTD